MFEFENVTELWKRHDLSTLRTRLCALAAADVAELLVGCENEEQLAVLFRLLTKKLAADTFPYLGADERQKLINVYSDRELREITDALSLDDLADVINGMPADIAARVLRQIPDERRTRLNELLRYPDSSAGSIMSVEYISLFADMSVADAFEHIRAVALDSEAVYTCFVIDLSGHLLGVVPMREILLAQKDVRVSDIMKAPVSISALDDREDAALLLDRHDLWALPVTDNGRLVGMITADDALRVIQEEGTEDFSKMAAISPSSGGYFKTSVLRHAFSRLFWLILLMLSSSLSAVVITRYESAFAAFPLIVAFLPLLMDSGGNCGAQSSTLAIRSLALHEITPADWMRVLWLEARVSVIIGLLLGALSFAWVSLFYADYSVAALLGMSMPTIILLANVFGGVLPLLAKVLHLDPATMSSPIMTTLADVGAVWLYFSVASRLLNI